VSASWVLIRSWHAIRLFRRDGSVETLCGRVTGTLHEPGHIEEELPEGKSCETCLRIYARNTDA
jgi:hypothetical protein